MKCLDNFANIGKAAIIQSLGIQKNYTEVIETTVDAIDYSNTACSTCKYKAIINTFDENSKPYADACASCASCPHKIMISTKWLLIIVTIVHIEFSQLRT